MGEIKYKTDVSQQRVAGSRYRVVDIPLENIMVWGSQRLGLV